MKASKPSVLGFVFCVMLTPLDIGFDHPLKAVSLPSRHQQEIKAIERELAGHYQALADLDYYGIGLLADHITDWARNGVRNWLYYHRSAQSQTL